MKTKSKHNRLAAVFLALAMLMTSLSFGMFASAEDAAGESSGNEGIYVLDVGNAETGVAAFIQGAKADGETEKAGTDGYFTIHYSSTAQVNDSKNEKFDDEYTGTSRIHFGGSMDLSNASIKKNCIEITTKNPNAKVSAWYVGNGDKAAERQFTAVTDNGTKSGAPVFVAKEVPAKNARSISKNYVLEKAGKYYLSFTSNNNYIFKIQVEDRSTEVKYTLDVGNAETGVAAFIQGAKADGETEKAGTDGYFTIHYSSTAQVNDSKNEKFDDEYIGTSRIHFGGSMDLSNANTKKNCIEITTKSPNAKVSAWYVGNGDKAAERQFTAVTDNGTKSGAPVFVAKEVPAKNARSISKDYVLEKAGKYYLSFTSNNNYIFKIEVVEGGSSAPVEREDWANVAAPVINSAAQTANKDEIVVNVSAVVGAKGGDAVKVTMLDKDGNEVETKQSLAEKDSHEITFSDVKATGTYTFKAVLVRDGEEDKAAANKSADFLLTLKAPTITSATSKGVGADKLGTIELEWSSIPEATGYEIYTVDGETETKIAESETTKYMATGLTLDKEYVFKVAAVRKDEADNVEVGPKSVELGTIATADAKTTWGYTIYGVSTNKDNNGYSVNAKNGNVTVYSEGGRGKIVNGGADGVTFYYTPVPNSQNFTLRAKMHVDKWTYSNGQEAMGMMVSDSIPETLLIDPYWTNVYYLTLGTVAYNWNDGKVDYNGLGTKYDMRFGLGVYPKLGITPENWSKVGVDANLTKVVDPAVQYTLETSAAEKGLDAGRYNLAGEVSNPKDAPTSIDTITDFIIEIQRNNTGYFFTYYAADGKTVIGKQKFYDRDALSVLDKDNIYVGFFAARNARATFSDIQFSTIDPDKDAPAEERPVEKIPTVVNVTSSGVANSSDYTFMATSNVRGTVKLTVNGSVVASSDIVTAGDLYKKALTINEGGNKVSMVFTPDPNQDLGEYKVLESTDPVTINLNVIYDTFYANQKNLYVSPTGTSKGNGSPENPIDIYTAVSLVKPGQTIVIMEGTYSLTAPVRIERGISGTADKPIRMIADPKASSRPVFDFNKACEGVRLGGDYWYMSGFDVTNSGDKLAGFRVCGSNNTIDQIITHHNGNSGLQISAFRDSSDPRELWPCNNLILNCTSYGNADNGYEDADGFAAKLTCGSGNVFDGCVSHHNADDGWDLYARSSSGSIGTVTIRNCVAYKNGFTMDEKDAGNGNGFKLGGENLPGGHVLENCITFNNKADGITSNSCPDVKVINCTSFNNGLNKKDNNGKDSGRELNLYTNLDGIETNYEVKGIVSYGVTVTDNRVKQNKTDKSTLDDSWKQFVPFDAFVNTKFAPKDTVVGIDRNEDGTINLGDFLKLKDTTTGADFNKEGGSTSSDIPDSIVPDTEFPEKDSHETPSVPSDPNEPSDPSNPSDPSTPNTPSDPTTPADKDNEFEDNTIKVTAPSGAFDKADEIKFNADPVVEETNDSKFTFELNFTDKDGSKIQPKVAVTVKIPVPEALKGKTIYVYHVEDDGKYTEIDFKVENDMVVFTASKFSKYVITSEKLSASGEPVNPEDNNSGNSGSSSGTSSDNGGSSGSGEGPNPSTGVAVPVAGMSIAALGAAMIIFISKRKRG